MGSKFNEVKFAEARLFCPQQDRRSCLQLRFWKGTEEVTAPPQVLYALSTRKEKPLFLIPSMISMWAFL